MTIVDEEMLSRYESLLEYAYRQSMESEDDSTKNCALIVNPGFTYVIAEGVNNFPRGVESTPERWERPAKYQYVEHAERNAIYAAVRQGARTAGMAMVCPWAACADCARAIVQSGIVTLVRHEAATLDSPSHWIETIEVADTILREGGVEIIDVKGLVGAEAVHNGLRKFR